MNKELSELSYLQTREKLLQGEITVSAVARHYIENIKTNDKDIRAFIYFDEKDVLERAVELDKKLNSGETLGKLFGCVIAIKDNINIKDFPTTCGSKILKGYISPYDATVIERLRNEDAVFIGKTNMDEFAMGSSTENSAYFTTKNPWDFERVSGGSSGGSAAAVAAGFAQVSLGSDTGGSIRQPASFCGVVGIKPTYGAVSRYGLVAFASSLDQIGPFARNVEDAAVLLDVISGKDDKDSSSQSCDMQLGEKLLSLKLKDTTVGIPKEYFAAGASAEIVEVVYKLIDELKNNGVVFKEISLPQTKYGVATYYIIAPSEASSNLARFDGVKYGLNIDGQNLVSMYKETREAGFGAEVKRRIMLGTYALSSGYYDAYYLAAQKVRTLITNDFADAFKSVDFILSPTTPSTAFKVGEKISDPMSMYLSDVFTISANLAGIPAMSIPAGFGKDTKMPVGVQIMAPNCQENKMLGFAKSVQDLLKLNSGRYPV